MKTDATTWPSRRLDEIRDWLRVGREANIGLHSGGGKFHIVWGIAVYLERNSRSSAGSMEERVSTLARGDLLRQASGKSPSSRRSGICMEFEMGVVELSSLGGATGETSAAQSVRRKNDN